MLKQFFSNDKAKQTLVNFITDGRLPHTLLLEGEDGSGKMTFARMIAAALLCEHLQPECRPCGECRNCRLVMSDSHPDVTVVQSEQKANAFHVDQIRALRTDAYVRPNDGACKVYLLRNVHYMTEQAQNALLKIIEEPPAQVVFILTCNNRARAADRCLRDAGEKDSGDASGTGQYRRGPADFGKREEAQAGLRCAQSGADDLHRSGI